MNRTLLDDDVDENRSARRQKSVGGASSDASAAASALVLSRRIPRVMGDSPLASEADCETDSRYGVTVPEGVSALRGVHYLHGLFPEAFMAELEAIRASTPVTLGSRNMYANRRFLRSESLAAKVLAHLPPDLGFTHVLSDLRFIEYPPGGHILAHVDGVRRDDVTFRESTTSMLLFTEDVPEGEGGETEFLTSLEGEAGEEPEVLFGARPSRGSILLFPHQVPHRGACVGMHPKILLRGDLY